MAGMNFDNFIYLKVSKARCLPFTTACSEYQERFKYIRDMMRDFMFSVLGRLRSLKHLLLLCAFLISKSSSATHIYGGDLFYTHVSGNTYVVGMYLYADCAGSAFSSLPGAPEVLVINGNNTFKTLSLKVQAPVNGLEVTPVCPAQISSTKCKSLNNPYPGVTRFYYTDTVTLNTKSANWRFRFTGQMGTGSTPTGRTTQMTNIYNSTGNSHMVLEATLNNTIYDNSSPLYTTIPTPFYCINKLAQYNPGIVDVEGDSVVHSLVPGIQGNSTVSYRPGYSGTNPLSYVNGSFSFSNTTGQLVFVPNIIQQSLVVTKAEEYRNGVLIGSSMREMTFIVWNCFNNPPGGLISNNNVGTLDTAQKNIKVCQAKGTLTFQIVPTDLDTHKIDITGTGLPAGATMTVSNNNSTAPTINFSWNLDSVGVGTHSFYITYLDDGCPISSKQSIVYTVTVLPDPIETVNIISDATCTKQAAYTTSVAGSGQWSMRVYQNNSLIKSFNNLTSTKTDSLAPGTYTISVFNTDSCFTDTTITISPPPPVSTSVDITNPLCYGDSTGAIIVNPGGGKPSFTYRLNSGIFGTDSSFNTLPAGTYTIRVVDQNECYKDTSVTLTQPTLLKIDTLTQFNPLCYDDTTGQLYITATGGVSPYTYTIGSNPYANANTFNSLPAATYILYAKDSNGCIADTTTLITQPTQILQQLSTVNPACNGDSSGVVTVTASGGTPSYTYAINNGAFGSSTSYTNLPKGAYTFSVKDINGCQSDTTLNLTEPNPLTIDSLIAATPLCYNDQNGSLDIYGSGGTPSYTYALGTGGFGTNNSFGSLGAGNYTLIIRDDKGCEADTTYQLTQPQRVSLFASVDNPDCNTLNNGSVLLTGGGGTPGYTYALGSGTYTTNTNYSSLSAGTYTFHVKDTNNCQADTTVTLADSLHLNANLILTNAQCKDSSSGHIVVQPGGGAAPYTFSLNNGGYQNGAAFNNIPKGTYTIKVKDALGCLYDTSVSLTEPTKLLAQLAITTPQCNGDSGSVTITGTGGTPAYAYARNTGSFSTSTLFTGLPAGSYTFSVRDQNNCLTDTTILLLQPPPIYVDSLAGTDPLCHNDQNGVIYISGSGGTPTLTYSIGSGSFSTGKTFTGLASGTYTLHIQDANGCKTDTTYQLQQPAQLNTSLLLDNSDCKTLSNGKVELFPYGGTPGYKYSLGSGTYTISHTFAPLPTGTYTFHVRDSNNCQVDTTVSIFDSLAVTANIFTEDALCYDSSSGLIKISASGGATPYTYAVNNSPPSIDSTITTLKAGTYTVHVKDNLGCKYDTVATLDHPSPLIVVLNSIPPSCVNDSDGKIVIKVAGGTKNYRSTLGNTIFSDSVVYSNLSAKAYNFDITDSNNCLIDTNIAITDPAPLNLSVSTKDILCYGDSNGTASINVTGGTPGYSYARDSGSYSSNSQFTGLTLGQHTLEIKDSKGCLSDTTINIGQPEPVVIEIDNITNPTCVGYEDGSITVSGKGGTPSYTYSINNGNSTTSTGFEKLSEGLYNIILTDKNNCVTDTSVELIGLPDIIIDSTTVNDITCYGYQNGKITVYARGGVQPFTYELNGGKIQPDNMFDSLSQGIYKFKITDSAGCAKEGELEIDMPEELSVNLNAVPNNCDKIDNSGYIEAYVRGGTRPYSYRWLSDSLETSNVLRNIPQGLHSIILKDANDCIDSSDARMEYDICCKIFIPDAFTPNGDGINDDARIFVKGEFQLKVFSIYSRFGERVFTTNNINEGWNGAWKGEVQDISTFNYYAEGICGSDPVFYKGTITLIK